MVSALQQSVVHSDDNWNYHWRSTPTDGRSRPLRVVDDIIRRMIIYFIHLTRAVQCHRQACRKQTMQIAYFVFPGAENLAVGEQFDCQLIYSQRLPPTSSLRSSSGRLLWKECGKENRHWRNYRCGRSRHTFEIPRRGRFWRKVLIYWHESGTQPLVLVLCCKCLSQNPFN